MKLMRPAQALFCGLFLMAGSAFPQNTAKVMELTLEQAIALGLENATSIKIKRVALGKARTDLEAARAGYYPNLSASTGWSHLFKEREETPYVGYTSPADTLSVSVELNQPIFTFGRIQSSVRMAEESLKLVEEGLNEEMRSLTMKIRRAFYSYLLAEEVVKINEETLANKLNALEVAQRKFRAGVSSDYDVLQAETDVESFKPTVITSHNQIQIALITVKDLLGLGDEEQTEVKPRGSLDHREASLSYAPLLELALANRYDIKSARTGVQLAALQKSLSEAARMPSIAGFLNYTAASGVDAETGDNRFWGEDSWEGNLTGGLTVQIPLSAWLPWSSEAQAVRKGALSQEESRLSYDSVVSSLKTAIKSTLLRLEEEKLKIASARKGLTLAERLHRSATEQYARGLISNMILQDAQLSLSSSRLAFIQAVYNYRMNLYDIMEAVGVDKLPQED